MLSLSKQSPRSNNLLRLDWHAAPPARHLHAVHQLPELDAPPRHDDLDVGDRVVSVVHGFTKVCDIMGAVDVLIVIAG